ncbi:MAG: hypothetical protein ACPICB_04900 [Candidatus Poseidoniaceae archaeon]
MPGLPEKAQIAREHVMLQHQQLQQMEDRNKKQMEDGETMNLATDVPDSDLKHIHDINRAQQPQHEQNVCGEEDDHISFDDENEDAWSDYEEEIFDTQRHIPVDDEWISMIQGSGSGVDFAKAFQYNGGLPLYYIMHLCLMNILAKIPNCNLGLHDQIMDMFAYFSDKDPDIWSDRHKHKNDRESVLEFLRKFFKQPPIQPDAVTMDIDRSTKKVTVPARDFRVELTSLLTNPHLMKDENFIQSPTFDIKTMRPTKLYEDLDDCDILDEFHTGSLYSEGIQKYCAGPPPHGIDMVIPTPIIFYSDESTTDRHGSNTFEAVKFAPAFFSADALARYETWRDIGSVPNLGVGVGRYAHSHDDEFDTNGGTKSKTKELASYQKLIDTHRIYDHLLESVRNVCREGGVRVMFRGKRCLFRPYFLGHKGDAKGQNHICCHYNANGSLGVSCLCKDCKCNVLDNPRPVDCEPITLADLERAYEDAEYAKSISYRQIPSAWNSLPMANTLEGISGSTPFDSLHTHNLGSYPDFLKYLHNLFGEGGKGAADKDAFDKLFDVVSQMIYRNSERRIPRSSTRHGQMDLSRKTAVENEGNVTVSTVSIFTTRGEEVIDIAVERQNKGIRRRNKRTLELIENGELLEGEVDLEQEISVNIDKIRSTAIKLLSYVAWCYGPKQKWELDNADEAVFDLMYSIKTYTTLPKRAKEKGSNLPGCNGHDKIKYHAIWIILQYMHKFGSTRCTDTAPNETHHKITTWASTGTQRRSSTYGYQVHCREAERRLALCCAEYVCHEFPRDHRHLYTTTTSQFDAVEHGNISDYSGSISLLGKYLLTCTPCSSGEVTLELEWNQRERNDLKTPLSTHLTNAIKSYQKNLKFEWMDEYHIRGYTEARVTSPCGDTIYRCSEDYRGNAWNDWALFNENLEDDDNYANSFYIGQIVGFFQYLNPGYPTPGGRCADAVKHEPLCYVAVRGSANFYTKEDLNRNMVTRFELSGGESVSIIPIDSICQPAVVVPNVGAPNKLEHLYILPKHRWGGLFRDQIKRGMKTK